MARNAATPGTTAETYAQPRLKGYWVAPARQGNRTDFA